jgi:hypothetical protein
MSEMWTKLRREIMAAKVTYKQLAHLLETVAREHERPKGERGDIVVLTVISFAPGELSPSHLMAIQCRLQAMATLLGLGRDEVLLSGEMVQAAALARLILPKDGNSEVDPRFDAGEFMALVRQEGNA